MHDFAQSLYMALPSHYTWLCPVIIHGFAQSFCMAELHSGTIRLHLLYNNHGISRLSSSDDEMYIHVST